MSTPEGSCCEDGGADAEGCEDEGKGAVTVTGAGSSKGSVPGFACAPPASGGPASAPSPEPQADRDTIALNNDPSKTDECSRWRWLSTGVACLLMGFPSRFLILVFARANGCPTAQSVASAMSRAALHGSDHEWIPRNGKHVCQRFHR